MESLRSPDPGGRAAALLGAIALLSCAASTTSDPVPVASARGIHGAGHRVPVVTVLPTTLTLNGAPARGTLQGHARDTRGPVRTTWKWTVRDTTVVTRITTTRSAATIVPLKNGATYVVAQGAGDSDSAFVTVAGINPLPPGIAINVGDNFQTKVDANPTGTTFIVKAGVHRFATVNPKASQQFYGEFGAVMTGARVLATWVPSGARWAHGGQTQNNTDFNPNYSCQPAHDGCFYPEQLWVNDTLYEHMTALADVTTGSQKWFFDYATDSVYVGRNPAGQTIETSVTPYAFGGSATGVVVKLLTIERYANAAQKPAVNYLGATSWRVDSNDVRDNHGTGIRLTTGGKAYGNKIHGMGQMGYSCGGTGVVWEDNEIYRNNVAFFGTGPFAEFGSGKCAFTTGLVFRNNYVHNNHGPGPWTDINNVGCVIELNTVDSNDIRGIFHEISFDCIIRNNLVRWNGHNHFGTSINAADRAGILISDSRNTEVSGNTLLGNFHGIMCIDAVRTQHPSTLGTHETENLNVHDNTVSQLTTGRAGGCSDSDAGHDPYSVASNNDWLNNTYTLGASTKFRWSPNVDVTWAAWRTAGQDPGSTQSGQ